MTTRSRKDDEAVILAIHDGGEVTIRDISDKTGLDRERCVSAIIRQIPGHIIDSRWTEDGKNLLYSLNQIGKMSAERLRSGENIWVER